MCFLMHRFISLLGIVVFIGLAWLMSSHKRRFPWRVVIGGLVLQFVLAGLILLTGPGQAFFHGIDSVFNRLIDCVDTGSRFVFGDDFQEHPFAFRVLPSIIFFAALMQVLYYAGIMQQVVRGLGYVVQRTLGTTGPESLAAAANIFVGQTEAPLVVRPYVNGMTRSELLAIMVPGFGSTAGGVLIAYKGMGIDAGHLLTASVLSAPASLLIAKVMIPETEPSLTAYDAHVATDETTLRDAKPSDTRVHLDMGYSGSNLIEAVAIGALEGLKLALNVAAMLIAFLALLTLADGLVNWAGHWLGQEWSLSAALSLIFAPLAWLMGIPWQDCSEAGQLLGVKMVANEFVAYLQFSDWLQSGSGVALNERSIVILTYALCGFANFGSIGIQIGGIGGMAPERQGELARLGLRAMLGGTLANFLTACVAGMMV
jgi:CNT family concentrative nucleoside transporter